MRSVTSTIIVVPNVHMPQKSEKLLSLVIGAGSRWIGFHHIFTPTIFVVGADLLLIATEKRTRRAMRI